MKSFNRFGSLCAAIAVTGLFAGTAKAGSVTYTGAGVEETGTGFGTVLSVLSLQNNGTEWGYQGVANNSTTFGLPLDSKGLAGNASNSNGSNLRYVSEFFAIDPNFIAHGDTIGLVFNINQEGNP